MEFNRSFIKKVILICFASITFYLGLKNIAVIGGIAGHLLSLIFPFILGAMVAFILNVPMTRIEHGLFRDRKVKGKRVISYLITLILLIGLISVIINIVVPQIAEALVTIASRLPSAYKASMEWFEENFGFIESYTSQLEIDWVNIIKDVSSSLKDTASAMVDGGIVVVSKIITGIVNFCIGFVFSVYILMAKESLMRQGKQIVFAVFREEIAEKIIYVLSLAQKTFSRFISGQCLEACILGCMFFITMSILRLPYAMLIAVLVAFTALIPLVGAFIGCAVGILLILMVNPLQALVFLIMFLVLQQVEGNLIYPHVVGTSVGLPSMWVLVAVTIGGKLMGIAGMIVFIPLVSVVYTLFRLFIKDRLNKKGIEEERWLGKSDYEEDVLTKPLKKKAASRILK